jgi:DNA-binding transcriptional LysR family regulator
MSDQGEPPLLRGLRISFPQVRSFVTLASVGNFSRAAEALNLSQPALTSRIRQLEEALELRLFDRTSRAVVLSDAGRELHPAFLRLVNDLEAAVVNAKEHVRRADCTVRLACLPSCAASLLPEAMRRFKAQRPDAAFVLEDGLNARVRELVRQGKVDFGICVDDGSDGDLLSEPLFEDHLQAVFPSGESFEAGASIDVAELIQHPLIMTNQSSSVRAQVERAFAARGLTATPAYEVNYMASAVALVRAGLGVAILPSTAAEARAPGVAARRLEDPSFARNLVLARRRDVPLRRIAEAFASIVTLCARA